LIAAALLCPASPIAGPGANHPQRKGIKRKILAKVLMSFTVGNDFSGIAPLKWNCRAAVNYE
jgi:hypothetical protein